MLLSIYSSIVFSGVKNYKFCSCDRDCSDPISADTRGVYLCTAVPALQTFRVLRVFRIITSLQLLAKIQAVKVRFLRKTKTKYHTIYYCMVSCLSPRSRVKSRKLTTRSLTKTVKAFFNTSKGTVSLWWLDPTRLFSHAFNLFFTSRRNSSRRWALLGSTRLTL